MTTSWGFVGRDGEWDVAISALRQGSGLLLVGPAGVGKSRFTDELHERAGEGWHPVRLRATRGTAELPLGVFAPVLPSTASPMQPMLVEARESLLAAAGERSLLICIDDVDLLDDTSAALVHQLVSTSDTAVVLSHRSGVIAPAEIIDLWRRGSIIRMELEPMGAAGSAALAAEILGAPLDPASAATLHAAAGGNPLYTRELLAAAREAGTVVAAADRSVGRLTLTSLPAASARLTDLMRSRLTTLPPSAVSILEHLAFAEPVGPGEIEDIGDPGDLERLEANGLIVVETDDRRLQIRLSHPLYGRILREGVGAVRRRTIHATLAARLQATGARRRMDTLKLARLAVDGGHQVDPEVLARGASIAYHADDHELARRLGQAGFERSRSFMPGWDLALAQLALGDLDGFDDHLEPWRSSAETPGHEGAVALVASYVTYWLRDDRPGSELTLRDAIAQLDGTTFQGPGVSADELRAVLAHGIALDRRAREALALTTPLLDRGPDQVLIRASLAAALGLRTLGRPAEAITVLDRAIEAYGVLGPGAVSLSARVVQGTRIGALVELGRLDEAVAEGLTARAQGADVGGLSIPQLVTAYLHLLRGDAATAAREAADAHQRVGDRNPGINARWFQALRALSHARCGEVTVAGEVLDALDQRPVGPDYLAYLTWMARAAHAVADARPMDAVAFLRAGISDAIGNDDVVGGIMLSYELLSLAVPTEAAGHLAELVPGAQGDLFSTMWVHADGAARDDVERLASASATFESMSALVFAAAAAQDTADAARRAGDQRLAARWQHHAAGLREQFTTVIVAPIGIATGPVPLTRREREIAVLAAQGLSSREIGERLYISRRTAETHLGRVYDKLGIRSRAELARVFDGGVAALVS